MPITNTNQCQFVKSLFQHFTPSPTTTIAAHLTQHQQPSTLTTLTKRATKEVTTAALPPTITKTSTTLTKSAPHSATTCRQCLHILSQLNALRQKLQTAHAAYTASNFQDERTFAHIPMLTVRSFRPGGGAGASKKTNGGGGGGALAEVSNKLEIRRNEAVNALFMADAKWIYVKTSDERRGFIPAKCCQPFAVVYMQQQKQQQQQGNAAVANDLGQINHYCKMRASGELYY
jgi:hypothetical protein